MLDNRITKIHITTHGVDTKMEGITSINTPCHMNSQCKKNAQVEGSICQKCYAQRYLNMRKQLRTALESNYNLLTSGIIPLDQLPRFNSMIVRFESFGDLNNTTQFINYLNICEVNPQTTFAIWSKNPHIISEVLNDMGYKKPNNLIIIISSLFLNTQWNYEALPYSSKYWFIDKIFTVYSKKYINDNNVSINCGSKKCLECKLCYTKNSIKFINEILK